MSDPNAYGRTPEERFWAKVDRSAGAFGCWPWTGARQASGYGRLTVRQRVRGAHQVSLEMKLGRTLAEGEQACHTCDNPPCVNPGHLFASDNVGNDLDKVLKGRSNRGERHGHSRLTEGQVKEIRVQAAAGRAHGAIASEYGVGRRHVSRIASREEWQHI